MSPQGYFLEVKQPAFSKAHILIFKLLQYEMGRGDGSAHACPPEFNPQSSGTRREPTPQSCPLTFIHMHSVAHASVLFVSHTHAHIKYDNIKH